MSNLFDKKYQVTNDNLLFKGEIVKSSREELFVMYDINEKKYYSDIMSIVYGTNSLKKALKYQAEKES